MDVNLIKKLLERDTVTNLELYFDKDFYISVNSLSTSELGNNVLHVSEPSDLIVDLTKVKYVKLIKRLDESDITMFN